MSYNFVNPELWRYAEMLRREHFGLNLDVEANVVISSSWEGTTVLTCHSSAHFQPIQSVVWEASMSKGCFVREAGTETSFTIFAFHCKSNLSEILTCKIPSPRHWHFFRVWGLFAGLEEGFLWKWLLQSKVSRDANNMGKFWLHFLLTFSQYYHM